MELDGAAYLFPFKCLAQRRWVEKLIDRSNFLRADEVTLQYLE